MPRLDGLGAKALVGEYNISGDVSAVDTIESSIDTFNQTGIDKLAPVRVRGLEDAKIEHSGFVNTNVGASQDALESLPSSDRSYSVLLPSGLGSIAASLVASQVDYKISLSESKELTTSSSAVATGGLGLDWYIQLSNGLLDYGSPGNLGVHDNLAATTGGVLIVHCVAFTGTSVTLELQQSSDNDVVDPYASLSTPATITFTGTGVQRLDISNAVSVEQFVQIMLTGTFTLAELAILYKKGV